MSTDPSTVRSYNAQAASYGEHLAETGASPLHAYYEKPAMREILGDLSGQSVLALGCGDGREVDGILPLNPETVVGVDIAEGLVSAGKSAQPERNLAVMDMTSLGFTSGSFDLVYSSLALHYLSDWEAPMAEIRRVLGRDGRFVFSCYHPIETALELKTGPEQRTALLGRVINSEDETREVHGDYMSMADGGVKKIEREIADSVPVSLYHRTLAVMATSIINAGFRIEEIVEPIPQQMMAEENEEIFNQVSRIPKFIIWALAKK